MNIPCQMRTLQNNSKFELLIEADPSQTEPVPAEVFMLCILLTAIRFAEENGMEIDRAMKDCKAYHEGEKMGIPMTTKDVN